MGDEPPPQPSADPSRPQRRPRLNPAVRLWASAMKAAVAQPGTPTTSAVPPPAAASAAGATAAAGGAVTGAAAAAVISTSGTNGLTEQATHGGALTEEGAHGQGVVLPRGRRKSEPGLRGRERGGATGEAGNAADAAAPSSGGLLVVVPSSVPSVGSVGGGRLKRVRSHSAERQAYGGGSTGDGNGSPEEDDEEAEQGGGLGSRKRVVRSRVVAVSSLPAGAPNAAAAAKNLQPDGPSSSVWKRLGGRNVQRGSEDGQIVIQRSTELDADYRIGMHSGLPAASGNHELGGISVVVRGLGEEEEVNEWYEEGRNDEGQAMKVRFGHDDDDEEDDEEEEEDVQEEKDGDTTVGVRENARDREEGRALGIVAAGGGGSVDKGQAQAAVGKGLSVASAAAAAPGASRPGGRPGVHKIYVREDLASDPTFLAQAAAAAAAAAATAVGSAAGGSQRSGRRSVKDRLGPRVEGVIAEEHYDDGHSGSSGAWQRIGGRKDVVNGDGSGVEAPVQVKEVVSVGGKTEAKKEVRQSRGKNWLACGRL